MSQHEQEACSGVRPAEEEATLGLDDEGANVSFPFVPSPPRDDEGDLPSSPGLCDEGGDQDGRVASDRARNLLPRPRRPHGPPGGRPAMRRRDAVALNSEQFPGNVDQVPPWDQELAFYSGRLPTSDAQLFRSGLYMGALRLWEDLGRPYSIPRRLLANGDGPGMDGFVRWRDHNRHRRLRIAAAITFRPSPLPASALRGGMQGSPSSPGSSDGSGDDLQLPSGGALLPGP